VTVVAGYDPTQIPDRTPDRPAIAPDHPVVARIVRDSSKRDPGDRGASVIFVIHSTYDFARQQLDLPADSLEPAARALLDAAGEVIPTFAAPQWHQVRRWRYAIPDRAHWETHLEMDADRPLACAGDWCGGNRVESALESGAAAAEAIARFLA